MNDDSFISEQFKLAFDENKDKKRKRSVWFYVARELMDMVYDLGSIEDNKYYLDCIKKVFSQWMNDYGRGRYVRLVDYETGEYCFILCFDVCSCMELCYELWDLVKRFGG